MSRNGIIELSDDPRRGGKDFTFLDIFAEVPIWGDVDRRDSWATRGRGPDDEAGPRLRLARVPDVGCRRGLESAELMFYN
jgi:hypothetical protein